MIQRTLRIVLAAMAVALLTACGQPQPPPMGTEPSVDGRRTSVLTRIADDRSTIADALTEAAGGRARAAEATLPLPASSPRLPAFMQLIEPMAAQEKELIAVLSTLSGLRDGIKAGGPLPSDIETQLSRAEARAAAAAERDKALRHRLDGILGSGS